MNKFFLNHGSLRNVLAGLAIAATQTAASAQDTALLTHGVTQNDPVYPYTGFSVNEDTNGFSAVVRFTPQQIEHFIGAKVLSIHIGWSGVYQSYTPDATAFVRTSLDGDDLATGTGNLSTDWNVITLDTPYEIKEGEDLILGYTVDLPAGIYGPCTTGYGKVEEGQTYISRPEENGERFWIDVSSSPEMAYPLMVFATAEVNGDKLRNIVAIDNLLTPSIINKGNVATGGMRISNNGINTVESIELTYTNNDGENWSETIELSSGINPNSSSTLYVPVPGMAGNDLKCVVSKVNGADNKNLTPAEFSILCVDSEISGQYARRPVMEYFASESEYKSAVYIDECIEPGIEGYSNDITKIYWHFGDQYQLGIAEEKDEVLDMLIDVYYGDKYKLYVPTSAIDRDLNLGLPTRYVVTLNSYLLGIVTPMFITGGYDYALNMPTFAGIDTKATVSDNIVNVNVTGNVAQGVLPEGEDLYVTVVALEDGVWSDSQEFPDLGDGLTVGEYTHNNLVRELLTDRWGDKIEIDAEGNFNMDFSFELLDEYNADNMRVAAFINRSGKNSNWKRNILNSSECSIISTGIESVKPSSDFTVEGNRIVAGDAEVEVYDLAGRKVNNNNLTTGVYIAKIAGSAESVKVFVK